MNMMIKRQPLLSKPEEVKALSLNEIINEGLSILKLIAVTFVNNKLASELRNKFEACEAHQRYVIWSDDLKQWAHKNISNYLEQSFFLEADSVPIMKSGIEYSFSNSPESILLMEQIRDEIKLKLGKLRELQSKTFSDKKEEECFKSFDGLILIIGSHEIDLKNHANDSNPIRLLKTLLKDPQREWDKEEIYQEWGMTEEDIENASKNKLYNAGRDLNEKIAQGSGIKDFIKISRLTAQILPKYLRKTSL